MTPIRTYRIVPGEGGSLIIRDDAGGIVHSGVDIRNEREALNFLGSLAVSEGLTMNVVKAKDGHVDRVEMGDGPRFNSESLRQLDVVKSAVAAALRRRAAERVVQEGRSVVTESDISAALAAALGDVAESNTDI